jgi:MFS family permease
VSLGGPGPGPEIGAPEAELEEHGAPEPRGVHTSALAVPAFRRLWIAGIVSDAGDWLMFIALPLVVLQLTGSALETSLAFLLELAPPVLLAPFVGRLVDRLPRRTVMAAAMVGQAICLLPLLLVHERSDLPLLYAVIVGHAACAALFEPAKNAMLPTLVGPERVVSANALVGLNNDLGRIVGGPLGGVLLVLVGLGGVALIDIGTYLVAVTLVLTLPRDRPVPTPATPRTRRRRRPRVSSNGILHAFADRGTRGPLVVFFVASVAQGLFVVLFVFFVTDVIGGGEADVGLLRGVQAVGAIAAGAALGVLGARLDMLRLSIVGVAGFAALTVLTWNLSFVTHAVPVYIVLFAAVGAPAVLMGAGLTSLLQRAASDERRGSVFAALGLSSAVGQAVGLVAAGLLQESVGTVPMLEVQAGCYVLAAVLAVFLLPRRVRNRARR